MPRSKKTAVIEALFRDRWDPSTETVTDPVVTLEQVTDAIRAYNDGRPDSERLSDRNPANFLKDVIRQRSANQVWPRAVFEHGYTARQQSGDNACFVFVPISEGQTEPFVDIPLPVDELPI